MRGVPESQEDARTLVVELAIPHWRNWLAKNPNGKVKKPMVCVVEYGDNIGTLKNMFPDLKQALVFAEQIIKIAKEEYTCIGTHQWYCSERNEYLKIESL
jgi:hypothetical protein